MWKALEAAQRLASSRDAREDAAPPAPPQDPADVPAEAPPRFGRADALLAVAGSFLAQREHPARTPGRYEVLVVVDRETLRAGSSQQSEPAGAPQPELPPRRCELEDGTPLAPETARRLACDAACVEVVTDAQGTLLDMGRRTRTISPPLQRALRVRDRGCRWPGCRNAIFVDGHHLQHWADEGETKLENLLLLCAAHHKLVHEGGFRVQLEAGQPVFLTPAGDRVDAVPPRLAASLQAASASSLAIEGSLAEPLGPLAATPDPAAPERAPGEAIRLALAGGRKLGLRSTEARALLDRVLLEAPQRSWEPGELLREMLVRHAS